MSLSPSKPGDLTKNTRTTLASRSMHFLFWNMSYHAEHHLARQTPFFRLPELHDLIADKLYPAGESYPAVHGEVLNYMSENRNALQ